MVLWILTILNSVSTTRILRSSSALSNALRLLCPIRFVSPNPSRISTWGLGSYPFARHYSGNRCFTFSSSGYLDVSVPRVPLRTLSIHVRIPYISIRCVPAFGYLRINAHLQLPAAFRSLSRPSSRLMPRHPPYALISLISVRSASFFQSQPLFPFGFFSWPVLFKLITRHSFKYIFVVRIWYIYSLLCYIFLCVFSFYMQLSMCVLAFKRV